MRLLSADPVERLKRAHRSLDGLSVGDGDTTCAIVGGMAALSVAEDSSYSIPAEWLQCREALAAWMFDSGDAQ